MTALSLAHEAEVGAVLLPHPRSLAVRSERILVVEDDSDTLAALEIRLLANRYEVVTAKTADRGEYLVREMQPDLVVLDLGLGEADGFDVLRAIQSIPQGRRPPVIVHSAWSRQIHGQRVASMGADLYLQKPASDLDLLVAIRELLDRRA